MVNINIVFSEEYGIRIQYDATAVANVAKFKKSLCGHYYIKNYYLNSIYTGNKKLTLDFDDLQSRPERQLPIVKHAGISKIKYNYIIEIVDSFKNM
jgi:hypothetical protein